jgi:hypothetical protein
VAGLNPAAPRSSTSSAGSASIDACGVGVGEATADEVGEVGSVVEAVVCERCEAPVGGGGVGDHRHACHATPGELGLIACVLLGGLERQELDAVGGRCLKCRLPAAAGRGQDVQRDVVREVPQLGCDRASGSWHLFPSFDGTCGGGAGVDGRCGQGGVSVADSSDGFGAGVGEGAGASGDEEAVAGPGGDVLEAPGGAVAGFDCGEVGGLVEAKERTAARSVFAAG